MSVDVARSDIQELLATRTDDEARLQAQWLQQRAAHQAALEEARTAAEERRMQVNARYGGACDGPVARVLTEIMKNLCGCRLRADVAALHVQQQAAVKAHAWNVDKLSYNAVVVAASEEEHQAMLAARLRQVSQARVVVGRLQVTLSLETDTSAMHGLHRGSVRRCSGAKTQRALGLPQSISAQLVTCGH